MTDPNCTVNDAGRRHQERLERSRKLLLAHHGRDPVERNLDERAEHHPYEDELEVAALVAVVGRQLAGVHEAAGEVEDERRNGKAKPLTEESRLVGQRGDEVAAQERAELPHLAEHDSARGARVALAFARSTATTLIRPPPPAAGRFRSAT